MREREWKGGELLDCYDQVVKKDICITITTRISASCNAYIVVVDKRKDYADKVKKTRYPSSRL